MGSMLIGGRVGVSACLSLARDSLLVVRLGRNLARTGPTRPAFCHPLVRGGISPACPQRLQMLRCFFFLAAHALNFNFTFFFKLDLFSFSIQKIKQNRRHSVFPKAVFLNPGNF